MFKDEPGKQIKNAETIIGPSVKVEGDFVGDGNVIVEGIVVGNLKTKNHLTIGAEAKVNAEIEANSAYISGEVTGNLTVVGDVELTASARIKGDISASSIAIERGAQVNGRLNMNGAKKPELTEKHENKK
ncbi:MAG: polymer-forming cytoskeletal protein [Candidatus Komeilibacteria bacterium]|nr:polymer-forming cytoskeletal protein [Candidatus Komeilibacteria bacterium]